MDKTGFPKSAVKFFAAKSESSRPVVIVVVVSKTGSSLEFVDLETIIVSLVAKLLCQTKVPLFVSPSVL